MSVRATTKVFPIDGKQLKSCGLPWGVTVTPFAGKDEKGNTPVYGSGGELLPRCDDCRGYYNTYCDEDYWTWNCSLCGSTNDFSDESIARYSLPHPCPETLSAFIDLQMPLERSQPTSVYVALVDLSLSSSKEGFLELTTATLLAALEALAPGSLFGLATFSHKIDLYDVHGPIPVVNNVFLPPQGSLTVQLKHVMPIFSFLAPVDTCKDHISSVLETLKPTTSWGITTAADQAGCGRGFGVAMEALLDYLRSEFGNTYALARVFVFLSGRPDYGIGQLDTRRYGEQHACEGEDADFALLRAQKPFYKEMAVVAVEAGVCVDIFAVTNEFTDLASLKFLSIYSGGSLYLNLNTADSTFPQDMYRMLSRPHAFKCGLRLRTSSMFKLSHSFGPFFPDPQYENVQHMICCDSFATYAYEFDFVNTQGFLSTELPTLQIAFQYTVVVPLSEQSDSQAIPTNRDRYSLQRRLRIKTVRFEVAANISEIYYCVDPEVVLSILVHEVILTCLEQGVRQSRVSLHEWFVKLVASYCEAEYQRGGGLTIAQVDVSFFQCSQLQPLPRLIYALLRNPLLKFHEEGVHPDNRIYLQCLFSGLEPSSLSRAVYPLLTSYYTPDQQAFHRHCLSRAALRTSGPILFLDAFTDLIVFYSYRAGSAIPFPLPQDCLVRATINQRKQERSITPRLSFIREIQGGTMEFDDYLVEDHCKGGSYFIYGMGFVSFVNEVNRDVLKYLSRL